MNNKHFTLLRTAFNGALALGLAALILFSAVAPAYAKPGTLMLSKVAVSSQVGTLTYGAAGSVTYSVTVTKRSGVGTATLSLTGMPTGASGSCPSMAMNFTSAITSLSCTLTVSTDGTTPAGANSFTVKASAKNNVSTTAKLTIAKKAAHVIANDASKVYGVGLSFTGTEFTTTGFVNGDHVTSVTLTSAGAVNTAPVTSTPYPITPSAALGVGLANYNIHYDAGKLTVTPASLNVTGITASPKVYDAGTSATLDVSAAVLNGVLFTDTVALDTSNAVGTFDHPDVATPQTVSVSGLVISGVSAGNYSLIQPTTSANITPAPLTVTAYSKAIALGDPTPALNFFYTGFLGSDTDLTAISTAPVCQAYEAGTSTLAPDPITVAGDYDIDCNGGAAPNYNISYVKGTLSVSSVGAPQLTTTPLNFGYQLVGTTSLPQAVVLQNTGSVDLHIFDISLTGAQFSLVTTGSETCYSSSWAGTLAPGASCKVYVQFSPTAVGSPIGSVNVNSDDVNTPAAVTVAGTGGAGKQILKNNGFELDANLDNMPDYWTKRGAWVALDGRDCTIRYSGKCSLKMVGTGKGVGAQQVVLVKDGTASRGFVFALRSRAIGVPVGSVYNVGILLYNGKTLVGSSNWASFATGTHGWQLMTGTYTASAPFNKIVFRINFKATKGSVWFDLGALKW